MNGAEPPESGTSEPVPLAVLARARVEVVRRLRKRLLLEIVAAFVGIAVAVALVQLREHQTFPFAVYALPTFAIGLISHTLSYKRVARNKHWLLRPSRRRASAQGYADRRLWTWGRRRMALWLIALVVVLGLPVAAAALFGFLIGANIAGVLSLRLQGALTEVQDVDPQVFSYYAQRQDDPIFTAPLTSAEKAAAPQEVADGPAFFRPPRSSRRGLPTKPTAWLLTSTGFTAAVVSVFLSGLTVVLLDALPENGHEVLGWVLFTSGMLAFFISVVSAIAALVSLSLRPRARRREMAAGYCTDPVETLKELLAGAPSVTTPVNS